MIPKDDSNTKYPSLAPGVWPMDVGNPLFGPHLRTDEHGYETSRTAIASQDIIVPNLLVSDISDFGVSTEDPSEPHTMSFGSSRGISESDAKAHLPASSVIDWFDDAFFLKPLPVEMPLLPLESRLLQITESCQSRSVTKSEAIDETSDSRSRPFECIHPVRNWTQSVDRVQNINLWYRAATSPLERWPILGGTNAFIRG